MEESILHQLTVTGYAVIFGLFSGVLFDLIRILRAALCFSCLREGKTERLFQTEWPLVGRMPQKEGNEKREIICCFITDLLFWCVLAVASVLFLFFFNDGIFRWFFAAGVVCGYCVYYFSVSRILLIFLQYILFFLKLFFRYILHFLSVPFIIIIRTLKNICLSFFGVLQCVLFRLRKRMFLRRYTEHVRERLGYTIRLERRNHR